MDTKNSISVWWRSSSNDNSEYSKIFQTNSTRRVVFVVLSIVDHVQQYKNGDTVAQLAKWTNWYKTSIIMDKQKAKKGY